jgi:hypothetical protein
MKNCRFHYKRIIPMKTKANVSEWDVGASVPMGSLSSGLAKTMPKLIKNICDQNLKRMKSAHWTWTRNRAKNYKVVKEYYRTVSLGVLERFSETGKGKNKERSFVWQVASDRADRFCFFFATVAYRDPNRHPCEPAPLTITKHVLGRILQT